MINPVQLQLTQADDSVRHIIIEPILNAALQSTWTYKIYKDAFGDETTLFTEPLELNEKGSTLPDEDNPDYIGTFQFIHDQGWQYTGDLLGPEEQQQVKKYLQEIQ